jgi:hypothetical protein
MSETKNTIITLPKMPKDRYYEDFVAAELCANGFYIERSIEQKEPTQVLELDIVTTKFTPDNIAKTICEVKSGGWGISDVFKVKGWLDYLQYDRGLFVTLNSKKVDFDKLKDVAQKIAIDLVDLTISDNNRDLSQLNQKYGVTSSEPFLHDCIVSVLRFAYALERNFVDYSRDLSKSQNLQSYDDIKDFIYIVNQHSFFQENSTARITEIFEAYIKYKNLTAKTDIERLNNNYIAEADVAKLSKDSYRELYYSVDPKKNPLHVAQYAELVCRLTILRLCIEETRFKPQMDNFLRSLQQMALPTNIREGILELKTHKYHYLYPYFWQIFIYVFGGIILQDKRDQEFELLSKITGIPTNEIDNALSAFDILFPLQDGSSWLFNASSKSSSNLTLLMFAPTPLYGLGANFRRFIYHETNEAQFEELEHQIHGTYTFKDLIKYNSILIEYLACDKNMVRKA